MEEQEDLNEKKTIKVSEELWSKLIKYKYELGCKSIEDLLERILKITPASELKKS